MMSFVANNFEIGWDKVRVAAYCSSDSGNLLFGFGDKKTADDIQKQGCPIDKDNPDNMHEILNKSSQLLRSSECRNNTKKAVFGKLPIMLCILIVISNSKFFVFTDGYLTENEKQFSKEAEFIRQNGKLFFFHLAEVGDKQLAVDAMVI